VHLPTLGLLRLLLWLLALLTAGELAALPACGRLLLVFGRRARRIRGALLLAGLLLAAPSCLSLLFLLTELGLVVLITHSLSPVAACRFATDGSNERLDTGEPDSGTPGGRPQSRDLLVDPTGRNAGSR
jgi:MFS family permease